MFKVNNKNTRRRSGIFNVNFEHISHLVLFLLTLSRQMLTGQSDFKILRTKFLTTIRNKFIKETGRRLATLSATTFFVHL